MGKVIIFEESRVRKDRLFAEFFHDDCSLVTQKKSILGCEPYESCINCVVPEYFPEVEKSLRRLIYTGKIK